MSSQIPMMTALHLSAALAALGPIMAQATLVGDGLGVLLLEGVSQQIRASIERLPTVEAEPDFYDPTDPDRATGLTASVG